MNTRKMHIGLLFHPYGQHVASWLEADAPLGAEVDIDHYVSVARIAEAGMLDFVFFADVPAVRCGNMQAIRRWPMFAAQFEPITLLGALAGRTSRIGLAATASTSYAEPYNLARQFASLDHLSRGRIGWNVVTTSSAAAALNFGHDPRADHATRYARAREFLFVVKGLWDSWEDDAFLRDTAASDFFNPDKLHSLDFHGEHFSVRGPLNVPRPPQGYPIVIQAGGSEAGKNLAAETADIVFTAEPEIQAARGFYADLKGRLAANGRRPNDLKILAALMPIVGRTRAEAEDRFAQLQSRIHPIVGREILSVDLDGIDLSDLKDEDIVPVNRIPASTQGGQSFLQYLRDIIGVPGGVTVHELYSRYAVARGSNFIVGSPTNVADLMEDWFASEACDGFMTTFATLPNGLKTFVDLVVPELRRRGRFRSRYCGSMLRDHLGLSRPRNRYSGDWSRNTGC